MSNPNPRILELLATKASTKQFVYRHTQDVFEQLKSTLRSIAQELNDSICSIDQTVVVEYEDRGQYEAAIRFSGDVIIFQMHSNVFTFDKSHAVWKSTYVKEDPMRAYFGMVNIYNFLSDSFKYNRLGDVGHLIGRLFVNKDEHFFVEGKRQFGFLYNNLKGDTLTDEKLKEIIEKAIVYALDFDLTTPDFNANRAITVHQIQAQSSDLKNSTAKKLGFRFSADKGVNY